MSEKEKYFDSLREFETTELFLTNTTDLVNDEIENNCVLISISAELAKQTSSTDFITFLNRVKTNRRQQLQESSLDVNLIYYLWFDEQAGHLRFNFINSNHDKLPFGCELVFVNNEKEILDSFLNSNYLEGIPWNELETIDTTQQSNKITEDKTEETFTLNVYREIIYRI